MTDRVPTPHASAEPRPRHTFRRLPDPPPGLPPILYIDQHIVVFNKPESLASVAGIGPEKADCLALRAETAYPGARIAHRLDRDTSGVIIMALTPDAHRELNRQFHDREVAKEYMAVVAGVMPSLDQLIKNLQSLGNGDNAGGPVPGGPLLIGQTPGGPTLRDGLTTSSPIVAGVTGTGDTGTINLPMRKDLDDPPRQIVDFEQGKPAETFVRIIERLADRTRVTLEPHTGRSHQLRVHLKAIGYPIVGDDLYAPDPWRSAEPRMLLHATRLTLRHPASGQRMTFSCPCPF